MEQFDNMGDFLNSVTSLNISFETFNAFVKAWGKIHGHGGGKSGIKPFTMYPKIMVSVSGGSDSDIMLDLIERIGHPLSEVHYVFFDTGLEFAATKRHLEYLEQKYGIKIERFRAKVPVPFGVNKYGCPFLSKKISDNIDRLQKHGFKWEDRPFDELYAEYPRCKSALRWWCNEWGEKSRMNIKHNKWLKEFMIENPPDFRISAGCCQGAKKDTAHMIERQTNPDLVCQGIRKAEGGARATAYKSCFEEVWDAADQFRPIFWFLKADKESYERVFEIKHSDCYCKYGLTRTGCACCPFGRDFEKELLAAKEYEPALYKAALHVFGKSYEYTRKYREYCERRKAEET